ncbi:DNA primase [Paenibacillus arenosi]|uniref:DNA primase n=1 Tax=Paenibacillus arenosi TaxID=2774142 RepID=A0ABR9ARJ4_9BACL|nr:DNA primase [Paenibacillus arenosi]MBD8496725.1 DNA primase [Paenibacillus arenosi]
MVNGNGPIPEHFIDEVLTRNDIVDVVSKYVHLSKHGKYLKGLCPFHSEKTPSFTVTPDRQIYHCYGCNAGGTVIKFLMGVEGFTFPEAVKQLAEQANLNFQWGDISFERSPQSELKDKMIEAHELAAKLYHYILMNTAHGQEALSYLRDRGINDKLIEQFQIGYAPTQWDTLVQLLEKRGFSLEAMEQAGLLSAKHQQSGYVDRFRDRIMFPIWDRNGKVIGFGGRILGEGQPKYLNSPETLLFNKSKLIYNQHLARPHMKRTGQLVLFEGYADVIQSWDAEVFNGIATMGTALTSEHVKLMKRMVERVIICYDGDNAGRAAASKAIPLLEQEGLDVSVAMLPNNMDPDDYIRANGAERFRHAILSAAVSPVKFQLLSLRGDHILLEDDGKRRYLKEALKLIAPIESPTEREMHLAELSKQIGVTIESLKQECFDLRQKLLPGGRGDNSDDWWNNVRNDKRSMAPPALLPAYVYAERTLLGLMFQDVEVADYVEQHLGEGFNTDDHAALAAYLYAYYAQGKEPDFSRFLAALHDDRLEQVAASISLSEVPLRYDHSVLDDYISIIQKVPLQREIERLHEEMIQAERAGDWMRAAQIGKEKVTLEQQLKR